MNMKRVSLSIPQLLLVGIGCIFFVLFACRVTGFSSFYLLTNPYYLPLKAVPAPPRVTYQGMNLLPTTTNWVLVYKTNSTLDEVVNYYREVLPRQGWGAEFMDGASTIVCIRATRNSDTFIIEIRQFLEESVARADINFPDSPGRCTSLFQ